MPKIVCIKTIITVSTLILKARVILVMTQMNGHFSKDAHGQSFK